MQNLINLLAYKSLLLLVIPLVVLKSFSVQELRRSHNRKRKAHPFDLSSDIFLSTLQKDPDTIICQVLDLFSSLQ